MAAASSPCAAAGRAHVRLRDLPGKMPGVRRRNSGLETMLFCPCMNSRVASIDHIQIAAPEGCESAARDFYGTILGMKEIEKPPVLRARGGCWFECGSQQVHIGVERDFQAG